ncbi:YbfB/YjiJ family MFS transporter [Streptomyces sp. NBC_01483]|uniref:YbfB/YjiJ family MFS transporter n=1 Tax=Streptomyces sp. NBC_01483 TaxID=2903883 RepID=UPI002E345632|nr:YbfB/YjiJ family MFS transporter [Streptomyces sp. NBC_01483]
MTNSSIRQVAPWRAISAGASATFVGIGLARFVHTPLLPELISNHWFSETAGAYLGAANLAGYLIGALAARRVARRLGDPWALRWSCLRTAGPTLPVVRRAAHPRDAALVGAAPAGRFPTHGHHRSP